MRKLIVGNWKMNGTVDSAKGLIAGIVNAMAARPAPVGEQKIVVCPPAVHLSYVRHALYGASMIYMGGQDCSASESGAHTGEISAAMLKDAGCSYVILGHSERRHGLGEASELIHNKVERALAADLKPIVCIGENARQREEGLAERIVKEQLAASLPKLQPFHEIVIAYEPVWAIGTGNNAEIEDIVAMHGFIRSALKAHVQTPEKVRILYGGSVNAENAERILQAENVSGVLVGGASLKAEHFVAIARAAQME